MDFDYDEFGKYGEEDYEEEDEEEDDEYDDDDVNGERPRRPKKTPKKKATRKSIFEIYEPSELKRGHFTDMDNEASISKLRNYRCDISHEYVEQIILFFIHRSVTRICRSV